MGDCAWDGRTSCRVRTIVAQRGPANLLSQHVVKRIFKLITTSVTKCSTGHAARHIRWSVHECTRSADNFTIYITIFQPQSHQPPPIPPHHHPQPSPHNVNSPLANPRHPTPYLRLQSLIPHPRHHRRRPPHPHPNQHLPRNHIPTLRNPKRLPKLRPQNTTIPRQLRALAHTLFILYAH